MDRTTWIDPLVEAWVAEHAIAVQIDSEDVAMKPFEIRSVPTIMLFRADTASIESLVRAAQKILSTG
jgi:hypothetical protein